MKKIFLGLLFASQFIFAQDLSKNLKPFKAITVTSAMDVELIVADTYKIEVYGKEAEQLKIIENGKELKLTTSLGKKFNSKYKVKIYFKKGLRYLKLANWVKITSKEPIIENFLELETINNVKVNLTLQTEDFIARLDLGSIITLKGVTESQKIEVINKSFYDAFNFKSKKAFIKAKSSQAAIYVSEFLDAEAKFKAEIIYMGNPFSINQTTFLGKINSKK